MTESDGLFARFVSGEWMRVYPRVPVMGMGREWVIGWRKRLFFSLSLFHWRGLCEAVMFYGGLSSCTVPVLV